MSIELKNIYKLFGVRPYKYIGKVKEGLDKSSLLNDFNHTLGLNNINLKINTGEFFVIMGLSGSGKSTLVRHMNRLIDPTDGEVIVDGKNIMNFDDKELREFRCKKISMVFQRFGLMPHKTVLENTCFGLKLQKMRKEERGEVAHKWIQKVGLEGYENSYPRQLSGGMQQRVGLARALTTNPEILLMDEPFSALDPLIRREMQEMFLGLQKELKKTIVFITHDIDEALLLADRIALLNDGELLQIGTPEEIVKNPANEMVQQFLGGNAPKI